jgi:adenosylcobinamide kinase / adenosylcobinamide-phosphate guanylyltransferase
MTRSDHSMKRQETSTLILGGARSGKSGYAEKMSIGTGLAKVYIATAQAFDAQMQIFDVEMSERIERHKTDRQEHGWITFEEPVDVPHLILHEARPGRIILVDCLTLWLSNLMHHGKDVAAMQIHLLDALHEAQAPVILVSNEVGMGLVPETPLGRQFRDAQGRLNQAVAARSTRVVFVVAGLPMILKGS